MTEKGYNLEILSINGLIERQLGNDCKESNLNDKKFHWCLKFLIESSI